MKQIKLELENEPGELAKISTELGKVGVNMESLFGKALNEKGILHFVTENPETAKETLEGIGYTPEITELMKIKLLDRPGEFGKVTRKLAHNNVNINSVYVLGEKEGEIEIALHPENFSKAEKILEKYM